MHVVCTEGVNARWDAVVGLDRFLVYTHEAPAWGEPGLRACRAVGGVAQYRTDWGIVCGGGTALRYLLVSKRRTNKHKCDGGENFFIFYNKYI